MCMLLDSGVAEHQPPGKELYIGSIKLMHILAYLSLSNLNNEIVGYMLTLHAKVLIFVGE